MEPADPTTRASYPLERRTFLAMVSGGLLAAPLAAEGQEARKTYRIGTLQPTPVSALSRAEFWDGLRDLGWVEGKNLTIERRFSDSRPERYADLAAELVRLKVDVIVTAASASAECAWVLWIESPADSNNWQPSYGFGSAFEKKAECQRPRLEASNTMIRQ